MKIGHIINPVDVSESSDLYLAQPITFETMRTALEVAKGQVEVNQFTAQYQEDRHLIPDWFKKTLDLERSVLDIEEFKVKRKLPLLQDILDRLYWASDDDCDYLIYTNVDIALMPNFYIGVYELINQGYDAFTITRRTIPVTYSDVNQIPLMVAHPGKPHPGHDCFIYRRDVHPKFYLDQACIGASEVGKIMNTNLIYNARNFKEFKDLHLTFHIGDDRSWNSPELTDYFEYNRKALARTLKHYRTIRTIPDHPLIEKYLRQIETKSLPRTKYMKRKLKRLIWNRIDE